ncbi:MAG: hypothetical protein IKT79_05655, partial [Akkermansia sp.]|nr:hypothetical protein [Akkermansia sp.]
LLAILLYHNLLGLYRGRRRAGAATAVIAAVIVTSRAGTIVATLLLRLTAAIVLGICQYLLILVMKWPCHTHAPRT